MKSICRYWSTKKNNPCLLISSKSKIITVYRITLQKFHITLYHPLKYFTGVLTFLIAAGGIWFSILTRNGSTMTYEPGFHSIAYVTAPSEEVAKDLSK